MSDTTPANDEGPTDRQAVPASFVSDGGEPGPQDLVGLLSETPERTKAEFQRLGVRVTMTPTVAENARLFYRADVVNSLPCLAGITEIRDVSPSTVDRSDPQAAGSSTSKQWGFQVDLPANQRGPGWRTKVG
jgi:hypothetical protein